MNMDEQRELALECGMAVSQGGNGYWDNVKQLNDYTAAVEAKRDEEVGELKNQLAVSQALNIRLCEEGAPAALWKEVAQVESKRGEFVAELTRKLAEQQAQLRAFERLLGKDAESHCDGELTALLAKERERCAVVCDNLHGERNGDCAAEIRGMK